MRIINPSSHQVVSFVDFHQFLSTCFIILCCLNNNDASLDSESDAEFSEPDESEDDEFTVKKVSKSKKEKAPKNEKSKRPPASKKEKQPSKPSMPKSHASGLLLK